MFVFEAAGLAIVRHAISQQDGRRWNRTQDSAKSFPLALGYTLLTL
jgi:hypothetical protein